MKRITLFLAMTLVLGFSGNAMATLIGNPTPGYKEGHMDVGIGLADYRTIFFGDYGLSKEGTLRFHYASLDIAPATGSEFGVGYKHNLGKTFKLGQYPATLSALGYFSSGSTSYSSFGFTGETKWTNIELGAGAAIEPKPKLKIYGAGILSIFKVETTIPNPLAGFPGQPASISGSSSSNDIGGMVGAEYLITPEFTAGAELNFGFNEFGDSTVLFASYKF